MAFSIATGKLVGVAKIKRDFALSDWGGESVVFRLGATLVRAKKDARRALDMERKRATWVVGRLRNMIVGR